MLCTFHIPAQRHPGDPFGTLLCERGAVVLDFSSRALVKIDVGDYMVDLDHVVAQFDARDRFDRDRGEG